MKYTDENVMAVAQKIVDAMDLKDLMNYVYDDLCALMDKDEESFNCNVDHFGIDSPWAYHTNPTLKTKNAQRLCIT